MNDDHNHASCSPVEGRFQPDVTLGDGDSMTVTGDNYTVRRNSGDFEHGKVVPVACSVASPPPPFVASERILELAEALDRIHVPQAGRWVFVHPDVLDEITQAYFGGREDLDCFWANKLHGFRITADPNIDDEGIIAQWGRDDEDCGMHFVGGRWRGDDFWGLDIQPAGSQEDPR